MRYRCRNPNAPNYRNYGGRGIKVCKEWDESFEAFWRDMEAGYDDKLKLDREGNNGNYEPSNCRWVTPKVSSANRRVTKFVLYEGESIPLVEAARRAGLEPNTLNERIRHGWPTDRWFEPLWGERTERLAAKAATLAALPPPPPKPIKPPKPPPRTAITVATPFGRMQIYDAADHYGIGFCTIYARIRAGWPEARWLEPPKKQGGRPKRALSKAA